MPLVVEVVFHRWILTLHLQDVLTFTRKMFASDIKAGVTLVSRREAIIDRLSLVLGFGP